MGDARFENWEPEIRQYCKDNDLSFEKALEMCECWNSNFLVLQYYDPNRVKTGLLDETPAPVVLRMDLVDEKPVFTQTEYTRQYLG